MGWPERAGEGLSERAEEDCKERDISMGWLERTEEDWPERPPPVESYTNSVFDDNTNAAVP
jgi:hypothetical protein